MDPDQFKKQFTGSLDEQSQRLDTTPERVMVIPQNMRTTPAELEKEISQLTQTKTDSESQPQGVPQPPQNPKPENVIRTFQSDAAQAIERKHVSVATIALAENMKKTGASSIASEPPKQYGRKILLLFVSLLLIGGALAGGYYVYLNSPLFGPITATGTPPVNMVASVVTADSQQILDVTSLTDAPAVANKINQSLDAATLDNDQMLELVVSKKNTGADGKIYSQKLTGQEVLSRLGITPPDILDRSLTAQSMIGEYRDQTSKIPFVILTTDFFQNSYIGMIRWEDAMAENMSVLFKYPEPPTVGTSTVAQFFAIQGVWSDAIIKNKDVRVFKNDAGQTLLIYSFIDKNTIVITTGENAIRNIVDRIEKQVYVR